MAREYLQLTFERGMIFDPLRSKAPVGGADHIRNWVPQIDGSLKPRNNYFHGTQTGTAPLAVHSIFWSPIAPNIGGLFMAEKLSSDTLIRRCTNPQSPSWSLVDTLTGVTSTEWVPFADGLNRVIYGNHNFPSDRLRIWDGATAADASTAAVAGRALAFHKQRFFSGGTDAAASRLHFSGANSATDWDVNRYIDVRPDNGTIFALLSTPQGLLIGKSTGLYLMTGDGPGSFAIQDIVGGEAALGTSMIQTTAGVFIEGSDGVYVWTGGLTCERLEWPNWTGGQTDPIFPISTAVLGDVIYFCDRFENAVHALDTRRGVWWLESTNTGSGSDNDDLFHFDAADYPSAICNAGFAPGYDLTMVTAGMLLGTTAPGVSYKNVEATSYATDLQFPVDYRVEIEEIVLGSGAHRATLHGIHMLLTNGPGVGDPDLTFRVLAIGEGTPTFVQALPDTVRSYAYVGDIGLTGHRFAIDFFHEQLANKQAYEIKHMILEYELEQPRAGMGPP